MSDPRDGSTTDDALHGATLVSGEHPIRGLDFSPVSGEVLASADRYVDEGLLGQGGMGEVVACRDRRLGRTVARKMIRGADGSRGRLERFLVEARVQGQLEHPSIVPVYDLGLDDAQNPYFTMKRVAGLTLERIIAGLKAGDPAISQRFSSHRLLSAFINVCLTVDYAHSKGVIHRDLKPANVMLGEFGEVYVLDWGIAKLSGDALPEARDEDGASASQLRTMAGIVVGSPGYLSPEQARGTPVDARSDVYALGAMLYEVLTLAPLHTGRDVTELLASTVRGVDAQPSTRTPERNVAPELEAICVEATRTARDERLASARAMANRLEAFLDGERDLAQRAELARLHTERAEQAIAGEGGRSLPERRRALREMGRALALDPTHVPALRLMVRLLAEPPPEVPAEVRAELGEGQRAFLKEAATSGGIGYLLLLGYLPALMTMGIKSWGWLTAIFSSVLLASLASFATSRWTSSRNVLFAAGAAALMGASTSALAGPFLVLPGFVAINTIAFAVLVTRRERWVVIGLGALALLGPVALEVSQLLAPSFSFVDDTLVVTSRAVHLPRWPAIVVLSLTSLTTMAFAAVYVGRLRDALAVAQERLLTQGWALRQLVPEGVASGERVDER